MGLGKEGCERRAPKRLNPDSSVGQRRLVAEYQGIRKRMVTPNLHKLDFPICVLSVANADRAQKKGCAAGFASARAHPLAWVGPTMLLGRTSLHAPRQVGDGSPTPCGRNRADARVALP